MLGNLSALIGKYGCSLYGGSSIAVDALHDHGRTPDLGITHISTIRQKPHCKGQLRLEVRPLGDIARLLMQRHAFRIFKPLPFTQESQGLYHCRPGAALLMNERTRGAACHSQLL